MNKYKYIILISIVFLTSCRSLYVGSLYSSCPTNNKAFFYNRMGVKPSKQYMMWGN